MQPALRHQFVRVLASLAAALTMLPALAADITRSSSFRYDSAGQLVKEVIEPSDPSQCVVSTYTLDGFGNRTGATTRNCNGSDGEAAAPAAGSPALFASRTASTSFSADGRFATKETNALGQSETRVYDTATGLLVQLTGPNGLATSWAYDSFGRKVLEKRADGNGTKWEYARCPDESGCAATVVDPSTGAVTGQSVFAVKVTPVAAPIDLAARTTGPTNGPYSKSYYDASERVIRTETQGFDGSGSAPLVYQDTLYNALGQAYAASTPYSPGDAVSWTRREYDAAGRVVKESAPAPNGQVAVTRFEYNGLVTRVFDSANQLTERQTNSLGQELRVTDAYSKSLTKQWDGFGNLLSSKDPAGNVVTMVYDLRGRRTQLKDPDAGTSTSTYNALGELVKVVDAKVQTTTYAYDRLGRNTQRQRPDETVNWYFDRYSTDTSASSCAKGVGKLCEVKSSNGYARKNTFDALGRPATQVTTLGATYTTSTTYDAHGRPDVLVYPSGLFRTKNVYTSLGYLKQVVNADAAGTVYWQATAVNAWGKVTRQVTGNNLATLHEYHAATGVMTKVQVGAAGGTTYSVQNLQLQYDTLGRLSQANDSAVGATRVFGYDNLHRMVSETRTGSGFGGTQTIKYDYDAIGNISARTDSSSTSTSTTRLAYTYPVGGPTSVRPHALSSTRQYVNGVAGATRSYVYDANGNLTQSGGRALSWTSADKVKSISETVNGTARSITFTYGADGERAREVLSVNGAVQRTTTYLNPAAGAGLFYEEEATPTATRRKHYVNAPGGAIAVVTQTVATNTWATAYLHKDLLGSTIAVTNASGAVSERYAYEPYGKRRNVNGTSDTTGALSGQSTRRGFTGHEMLDEFTLVNMNGRVFDPAVARFVSADPLIQAPSNLQSFNRYSYVMNSPTMGTDPSGYSWWTRHRRHVLAVVAIVAAPYVSNLVAGLIVEASAGAGSLNAFVTVSQTTGQWAVSAAGGAVSGAAGGFTSGLIASGGDMRAAANGAIAGGVFGAIGAGLGPKPDLPTAVAAHAAGGCAVGAATGGACGAGAAAAALGKFVTLSTGDRNSTYGIVGSGLASSVSGGLAAQLTGGRFADGAKMAGVGYLFNCLASRCSGADYKDKSPGHENLPYSSPEVCNVSTDGCMAVARTELACFSAPGQSACNGVGRGDVHTGVLFGNAITQYMPSENLIINGTSPGHRYHDGYIVRWIGVDPNGGVRIWTYGIGTNSSGYMALENQFGGWLLFEFIGVQNAINIRRSLNR
jgi:RHS repeat-associated protein